MKVERRKHDYTTIEGVYFEPRCSEQIVKYLMDMGYKAYYDSHDGHDGYDETLYFASNKKTGDGHKQVYAACIGDVIVFDNEESFLSCMSEAQFQKYELVESDDDFQDTDMDNNIDADIVRRLENIIEMNKRIERKINDLYYSWMNSREKIEK